ncbi:MAG: hypothetical protein H0X25_03980 [Acidobacteriales bacterium]|nr:hypothetical protein [Terriglobales bacterium]
MTKSSILLFLLVLSLSCFGLERATTIRETQIYVSPDTSAAKLGTVTRGRELAMLDNSSGWAQVQAELGEGRTLTGWIDSKGVVRASTPNGDRIIFGEAVDSEDQASQRHGRSGAAQDAMRLYAADAAVFPASPLAGESLYRSAEIRWQLEKSDVMARPSARQQDPDVREGMDESHVKEVIKKYPNTKWADMAAFLLIDNKLCGEWQNASKCPEKESELYIKYANDRPDSPKTPEALYDAAYRQGALIELYRTEGQPKKSDAARTKAIGLAPQVTAKYAQSDWGARAERLLFLIQQGVPTYGVAAESSSGGPQP